MELKQGLILTEISGPYELGPCEECVPSMSVASVEHVQLYCMCSLTGSLVEVSMVRYSLKRPHAMSLRCLRVTF